MNVFWLHKFYYCFWFYGLFVGQLLANQDTVSTSTRSNLDIQQQLVETIANDVLLRSGVASKESVSVRFISTEDGWITQNAFLKSLQSLGHPVFLVENETTRGPINFDVTGVELRVRYTDVFQDGFLGTKKVNRRVSARLDCKVVDMKTGALRVSDTFNASVSDTVKIDDIPDLESSSIKSTRGELPSERFIDRIVEPFIIIGATGVAVYLLFNIRSK